MKKPKVLEFILKQNKEKMLKRGKKAQAQVIVTILIILLVLAVIGVVATMVTKTVRSGSTTAEEKAGIVTEDLTRDICLKNNDCKEDTPLCNTTIGYCVECLTDNDCGLGEECYKNVCRPVA